MATLGPPWLAYFRNRKMGNKQRLIVGLALASLLTVNMSFADEIVVTEQRETATIQAAEANLDLAKEANAAVEKAVKAVLAETKLDLDIRLIGPTSVKIASDR